MKPEQLSPEVADPKSFVFGHGRRCDFDAAQDGKPRLTGTLNRLCPGREFADATLFLAISNMIAALDIGKSRDAEGNEITPKAAFASSSIIRSVRSGRGHR